MAVEIRHLADPLFLGEEGQDMTEPMIVTFLAGATGAWTIERADALVGKPLALAPALDVREGLADRARNADENLDAAIWSLRGFTSNTRYTARSEVDALKARQEGLGRCAATRAALIPIQKSAAWWDLAQDERRAIMEEQSRHITIGLDYLPAVARRLHHCRDLGEPFDFLTWFEFAPEYEAAFEELLARMRHSEEWAFVDREVDIRVSRRAG